MEKLSVIIANYNNGHFFKDAYDSLVAQTSPNWEAIIIDDASADNSVELIMQLIQNDSRFKFYQNDHNIGYQKTLNRAVGLCSGEIFGRLDPDDALYPDAVKLSLETHHNFPDVGLVYSDITVCNAGLEPTYQHKSVQINVLDSNSYLLAGEIGAFATFKKTLFYTAGGFDPFLVRSEDMDIYMKFCELAPVKRIPQPLYYYRIHTTNASKAGNTDRSYFWHWAAMVKMADRRNINLEELFETEVASGEEMNVCKQHVFNMKNLIKNNYVLNNLIKIAAKKRLFGNFRAG